MKTSSNAALAAEVWRRWFAFFLSTRHDRDLVLERLGLTPNDARAFSSLDERAGRSMRSLAEEWGCDASNATWIVERLAKKGYVRRSEKAGDRRVKLVTLTARGAKTKDKLLTGVAQAPRELHVLEASDLEALLAILKKLPDRADGPSGAQAWSPRIP